MPDLTLEPQPIADQWMGRCSCGRWQATASMYQHDTRESAIGEIRRLWGEHVIEVPHA
jgi:hypothetical protein